MRHLFARLALLCVGFLLSFSLLAQPAALPGVSIHRMIIFGDSLTDNGNDYQDTLPLQSLLLAIPLARSYFPTGIVPSKFDEPYAAGRFTNGKSWAEDLANLFGIGDTAVRRSGRFIDFAYGGAWAHATKLTNSVFPVPLFWQVASYQLRQLGYGDKSHTLAVLLIGANDYLESPETQATTDYVAKVVTPQINAIEKLYHSGIRHFLVVGLPALDQTPEVISRGAADVQREKDYVKYNDASLQAQVDALQKNSKYSGIHLTYIDLNLIHQTLSAKANLVKEGFKQSTVANAPCYHLYPLPHTLQSMIHLDPQGLASILPRFTVSLDAGPHYPVYHLPVCDDGQSKTEQHIYFDEVHPTAIVHCMMALMACQVLRQEGYQGYDFKDHSRVSTPLPCGLSVGSVGQQLQTAEQLQQAATICRQAKSQGQLSVGAVLLGRANSTKS